MPGHAFVTHAQRACVILVVSTILQVSVVLLQDRLGPRFFVPKFFLPVKYDYGRVVPQRTVLMNGADNDIETGGMSECVICYTGVDISRCDYMVCRIYILVLLVLLF
jgi:hypothetical protein